jgi:hypothetical protein
MKKNLLKSLVLLSIFFFVFSFVSLSPSSKVYALNCNSETDRDSLGCQCELGDSASCKTYCNDAANSSESSYSSSACVQSRLGLDEINTEGILIKTHPVTYLVYIFRFFLFIVTCVVVFRNVMAGMTIANAKDDAEKRTEGFKKLLNAAIGLVVAFSALGITELIKNAFTNKRDQELLIECKKLEDREANVKVIERCKELEKQYEAVTGTKTPVNEEIPCVPGQPC